MSTGQWRKLHKPEIQAYNHAYHAANARPRTEAQREGQNAWAAANRDAIRDRQLRRTYGLTLADVAAMRAAQRDACAICREPFTATPHVDHDHVTGSVRGLLCSPCNRAIGYLRDDPDLLSAAATYVAASRRLRAV